MHHRRTVNRNLNSKDKSTTVGNFLQIAYRDVMMTGCHGRERRQWAQNNIGRHWRDVFRDKSRFNLPTPMCLRNEQCAHNCAQEYNCFSIMFFLGGD